jgi:hypothetical protein
VCVCIKRNVLRDNEKDRLQQKYKLIKLDDRNVHRYLQFLSLYLNPVFGQWQQMFSIISIIIIIIIIIYRHHHHHLLYIGYLYS